MKALLIPIYRGHTTRFINLLCMFKAFYVQPKTIFFVVTDEQEQLYFESIVSLFNSAIEIINVEKALKHYGEQIYQRLQSNIDGCAINLKKLIGLKMLFERGYEGVAVSDSDILFLPNFEISKLLENLDRKYEIGVSLGAVLDGSENQFSQIMQHSYLFVLGKDALEQKMKAENFWYGWFFDVPYYRAQDFDDFIGHLINLHGEDWPKLVSWNTFDHIVYLIHLELSGKTKLTAYSSLSKSLPEFLSPPESRDIWREFGYYPSWLNISEFIADPTLVHANVDLMILYHSDRSHN